jgi:hypothetical protein
VLCWARNARLPCCQLSITLPKAGYSEAIRFQCPLVRILFTTMTIESNATYHLACHGPQELRMASPHKRQFALNTDCLARSRCVTSNFTFRMTLAKEKLDIPLIFACRAQEYPTHQYCNADVLSAPVLDSPSPLLDRPFSLLQTSHPLRVLLVIGRSSKCGYRQSLMTSSQAR